MGGRFCGLDQIDEKKNRAEKDDDCRRRFCCLDDNDQKNRN